MHSGEADGNPPGGRTAHQRVADSRTEVTRNV